MARVRELGGKLIVYVCRVSKSGQQHQSPSRATPIEDFKLDVLFDGHKAHPVRRRVAPLLRNYGRLRESDDCEKSPGPACHNTSNLVLMTSFCQARSLLNWQQLDGAEFDPVVLLALESDDAGRVLGIVRVAQGLAVQDDHEVVALGRDLVAVPLVGDDLDRRRLDGSHQAAGIVSGWLIIPDLQLVTGDVR